LLIEYSFQISISNHLFLDCFLGILYFRIPCKIFCNVIYDYQFCFTKCLVFVLYIDKLCFCIFQIEQHIKMVDRKKNDLSGATLIALAAAFGSRWQSRASLEVLMRVCLLLFFIWTEFQVKNILKIQKKGHSCNEIFTLIMILS